jgi:hypothetical protein
VRPPRLVWRLGGALVLALVLVAVVDLIIWPGPRPGPRTTLTLPTAQPSPQPSRPSVGSPSPSPTEEPPPVLSLTGSFPAGGPGTFAFAESAGEVLGETGPLRAFRVAIEDGIDEDVDEFAAFVDETLAAEDGWTTGGLRFQRVPPDASYDFTVYLATGETAADMCAAVGVDIHVDGEPYTSCRGPGRVILNLNRWRLSVPEFVAAEVPLVEYRRMVLNHEVGHELGHGHERCPGAGEPAPVMQQQTLFLDGCEAYPWPYLDGRRYAGPPA